jgi:hypothetical protein
MGHAARRYPRDIWALKTQRAGTGAPWATPRHFARHAGAPRGRAGFACEGHGMTYYKSKAAAQALADELTMQDRDAWRYDVQACPRGFYVAVFDDDGHFLGVL